MGKIHKKNSKIGGRGVRYPGKMLERKGSKVRLSSYGEIVREFTRLRGRGTRAWASLVKGANEQGNGNQGLVMKERKSNAQSLIGVFVTGNNVVGMPCTNFMVRGGKWGVRKWKEKGNARGVDWEGCLKFVEYQLIDKKTPLSSSPDEKYQSTQSQRGKNTAKKEIEKRDRVETEPTGGDSKGMDMVHL